ncbi:TIGR02444 family protein [Futiania mangrovi]|uniref:TIGR02444 family protein n=1 Tax=Futiania mangrovi TaxID=2959716 RepID=A0A9J6P7M3_9PROT|nr:TIGR02444 family protein [Futiania mangrovii]MCP1334860.1 TIGR02444 family protein [Futiania mangrovii]
MEIPEGTLWRFAVALYGQPGVADDCLALQDRYGAAVTVILWLAWAWAEARPVPVGEARGDLLARIGAWRAVATDPLRAVRRAMKPHEDDLPLGAEARAAVKAAELACERAELALLEAGTGSSGRTFATLEEAVAAARATLPQDGGGAEDLLRRIFVAAAHAR